MSDRVIRATITGRVQGVGFRAFVEGEARVRRLKGWVRNRRDGSVEAVFSGPADVVDDMLTACRRGPRMSRVDSVDVEAAKEATLQGSGFAVLPTASAHFRIPRLRGERGLRPVPVRAQKNRTNPTDSD